MANLEVILKELRDFRKENSETLKEIKEDINKTNNRMKLNKELREWRRE